MKKTFAPRRKTNKFKQIEGSIIYTKKADNFIYFCCRNEKKNVQKKNVKNLIFISIFNY